MTFGDIRSILMQALYFVLTRFAAPIYWAPATFGKSAVERVGLFRQPFLGTVQKGKFKRICNGKVHSLDVRQSFPSKKISLAWTGRVANIKEDNNVSWKTRSVTAGVSSGTKFWRVAGQGDGISYRTGLDQGDRWNGR